MSNEKLAEQLAKLKETLAKWEKELIVYSKWAIENDGIISAAAHREIDCHKSDIQAIKTRITQIEETKDISSDKENFSTQGISESMNEIHQSISVGFKKINTLLNEIFKHEENINGLKSQIEIRLQELGIALKS